MADFSVWLKNQDSARDADLRELREFANGHTAVWPSGGNDVGPYLEAVAGHASDEQRNKLLTSLARSYANWKVTEVPSSNSPPGWISRFAEALSTHLSSVMLTIFGILAAGVILVGIFKGDFLTSLAQPSQARGFITFLFAFSTIAIFLLIAITTFWMEKDEVEARFAKAKDLLTILIGIFGTILGFYFGSLAADTNTLSLANMVVPSFVVTAGDSTTISATVLGGSAPVTYDLTFNDPTGAVVTDRLAMRDKPVVGGAIAQSITIPADVSKAAGVTFTLIVHDARGNRAQQTGTLFVQPKPKT
jgi:putative Ca2+/H+ antiporter (TMEM165/GDT1 family)